MVEKYPNQMPEPLGESVYVGCFIESEHSANVITGRLHSVILLFVNNTLIKSFSKYQNIVQLKNEKQINISTLHVFLDS